MPASIFRGVSRQLAQNKLAVDELHRAHVTQATSMHEEWTAVHKMNVTMRAAKPYVLDGANCLSQVIAYACFVPIKHKHHE